MKQIVGRLLFMTSILIIMSGCSELEEMLHVEAANGAQKQVEGEAVVSYLDVGQGDSTLVQTEEATVLIDTGRHDQQVIFDHLEELEVDSLDLLIFTHPHADHIGNGDEIIEQYQPDEVWIDGNETTSQVFERLLDALLASDADVTEPIAGESYQVGTLQFDILNPNEELTGDLNNDSISFIMHYGDTSFLFTGDAERPSEQAMVNTGLPLSADIYQMGHHGSNTSSHDFFMEAVQPKVAIYSASENNSYGHPGADALSRVEAVGAEVFGTIEDGTVTIRTDGTSFEVETER
ncbi:ComEC/Rec2 family competence protein [Alkalicoccobacillus murimartini]|uniref:Beta-lactamase superfamily II metal-dependent hydrolase n=1 Tax=Alkalicoccobacillus murimartini TaxID=171685 RepID=A0ABT9YH92_9BACI|nr:ComEC/Rec2 family competence protein [Alkalicoccobacillus murimartini]MDQ0206865.1 beta-lactamase superfamily II metal-dependent hydrolase [Alkalicoccobacillus murimartini]